MRRVIRIFALTAAVAAVNLPAAARAESYFNPFAGLTLSGEGSPKKGLRTFGAAAGDTGSVTGFEINFGYTPDYSEATGDQQVVDLMVGLTVGPEIGGDVGVKPYAAGGVGLLRTSSNGASDNNFGFNVGGGVFINLNERFGVRGDVRYFRGLNGDDLLDFNFTRAQIGIVIK
jgi:opacity protein-like surface antigen